MNVNRAANNFLPSSDGLVPYLRTARMALTALALFGCLGLVRAVAGTDEPPALPLELTARVETNQQRTETVPVRPAQTDWLDSWSEYRLDPPIPPLDLMIVETQPVSASFSNNLPKSGVETGFLANARVFSIMHLSESEVIEADSEDQDETHDSIGQPATQPLPDSVNSNTRIFEFTAVSGNVEPIDPSILQLPQIFQVAEVRVVPATTSAGANRANATTRSTIRRRSQFVAARTQPPAPPVNPNDPMATLGFTPLAQLSVDTALQANPEVSPELQEPESDAGQLFETFGQHHDFPVLGHIGLNPDFFLEPADFCHQPLYFEEINLERFGTTRTPRLQPVVSGASFFVTVPAMPYLMTVYRPRVCYQDMSPYRPGRPAPWHRELPPIRLNAAAVKAALIAGMFFVIP
jgi:hypothetical protein